MRPTPLFSAITERLSGEVSSLTVAKEARLWTPFVKTTAALTLLPGDRHRRRWGLTCDQAYSAVRQFQVQLDRDKSPYKDYPYRVLFRCLVKHSKLIGRFLLKCCMHAALATLFWKIQAIVRGQNLDNASVYTWQCWKYTRFPLRVNRSTKSEQECRPFGEQRWGGDSSNGQSRPVEAADE